MTKFKSDLQRVICSTYFPANLANLAQLNPPGFFSHSYLLSSTMLNNECYNRIFFSFLYYFSIISSINKLFFLMTKMYIWCHNLDNLVPLMNVLALPPVWACTTVWHLLAYSIALQSTCRFRFHERCFLLLSSRTAGSIVYVVCNCVWRFVHIICKTLF